MSSSRKGGGWDKRVGSNPALPSWWMYNAMKPPIPLAELNREMVPTTYYTNEKCSPKRNNPTRHYTYSTIQFLQAISSWTWESSCTDVKSEMGFLFDLICGVLCWRRSQANDKTYLPPSDTGAKVLVTSSLIQAL